MTKIKGIFTSVWDGGIEISTKPTLVVMKEGVGKTLYEATVCSDPDCENQ